MLVLFIGSSLFLNRNESARMQEAFDEGGRGYWGRGGGGRGADDWVRGPLVVFV